MKPLATRQSFGEALADLGGADSRIVVLDADLSKSTKSELFAKKFPERFFEMGIAEANMIGTGAGLALSGLIPFICSFGCFVTGRYDQIRMSVAYSRANVKIVGTHAGIGIGDDGHSQMGLEDLALLRGLPGLMVFQPCDDLETRQTVAYLASIDSPAYLRLTRQALAPVHGPNYRFEAGKLDHLKTAGGIDRNRAVALLGSGATVQECLAAADLLASRGIDVSVINVHTLKPFDQAGVALLARSHRVLVTVEDHYTTGGLGSCVAEALADEGDRAPGGRLLRLGVQDRFGQSGEPAELFDLYGFSAKKIVESVVAAI